MKRYVLIEKYRERKCSKCGEVHPATLEFFHRDKWRPLHLKAHCTTCDKLIRHKRNERFVIIEKVKKRKCRICEKSYPPTLEFFHRSNEVGLQTHCKECAKIISKTQRVKRKDATAIYQKQYRIDNKERLSERDRIYRERDYVQIREKNYYENNKEKCLENSKRSEKKKLAEDTIYKFRRRVKDLIRLSLKKQGFSKNTRTANILGCDYDEFRIYIENQFLPWMNWDNYGLYNGELNFGWDFDHKIPLNSAITEGDIIKLNHYTNIQPLCSYVNRHIKRDKLDFKLEF